MKKITYIYQAGRSKRMDIMDHSAKEFYYGYFHAAQLFEDVKFLEFNLSSKQDFKKYLNHN